MKNIVNAKQAPQIYYGLHMAPGVAEYREAGREPYRIMIEEETIKNMDPTFSGKPVYVRHVNEVNWDQLQAEADGYVVESFFNQKDGKHWVKFIVVSDRGHEAIRNGWKLSNAYVPKSFANGGRWHGVEYAKEVTNGEYEHLAIVPDPRYEESVILTPEQFKSYNGEKELELLKLANDKGDTTMKLNFFKKQKVENTADLEGTTVVLPKSGRELTIADLVKNADEVAVAGQEMMANGDHHIMVGEHKMKVNELVEKYAQCMNELSDLKKPKQDESDEEAKKKALELAAHEEGEIEAKKKSSISEDEEKKKNADKAAEDEKKKNADKAADEEKKKNALHFEALKNANMEPIVEEAVFEMMADKIARGKSRYGSV
jgi:hypothetical protein